MPAGSRFKSQRLQSAVVAATMFLVLLASVGVARQIGDARNPRGQLAQLHEITADELRFHLPVSWQQVQTAAGGRTPVLAWVDTARPARRLGLVKVTRDQGIEATGVLQSFLPLLMGQQIARQVRTVDSAIHPHPQLHVLEWAGASESARTEPRLHLAADLTADHHTHFLFYLTDEVQADENGREILLRNLALLRAVHQSARLLDSPPAP